MTGVATRFKTSPPWGESGNDEAGLYDAIRVKVENLSKWAQNPANHPDHFILYVNGYQLGAVHGRQDSSDSDDLLFDLRRTDDTTTQASWRDILNRPDLLWPKTRPSSVSIGYS